MHGAQEPAELLLIIQVLETCVGLVSRWHIDEGETDTCHDLDHEAKQRTAPEDIEPTPGSARHSMACGCSKELAYVEPVVNPQRYVSQSFNHIHHRTVQHALACRWLLQRWELAPFHKQLTVLNLVLVFIKSTRRWPGSM